MVDPRWYRLGFSDEDVFGAWQHERLAGECARALGPGGVALDGVLESHGEGRYVIFWYVNAEAARRLDDVGVHWRRFLVGEIDEPPARAYPPLRAPEPGRGTR